MEMRDEVFSSVGAQDVDTSGFQVSDLGKVGFKWENDQLDVDTVFRPGIDNVFSPTAFDDLEIGGAAEKPILFDKKGGKENSPPKTSVSETPKLPSVLLRSRLFGTITETVHDYVYRKLFQ